MNVETVAKILIPTVIAAALNIAQKRFIQVPKNLESPRTNTYVSVLKSFLSVFIYVMALYYIFTVLQINMTPIFASAGAVGIIIGLGLRSFIEDFFTGMFILTEDTVRVGDYVDIGGSEGVTESLGLRTVRIRDKNGAVHIFPNREIKKIVNFSRRQARVIVDFPVKTNQPIDDVIGVLEQSLVILRKDKIVGASIHENSRVEGVDSIHPGHIIVRTLILTKAAGRWSAGRTFRRLALKEFDKAKILLS